MGAQQERRHALGDDQNDRGAHGARHQAADEARRFAELSPSSRGCSLVALPRAACGPRVIGSRKECERRRRTT